MNLKELQAHFRTKFVRSDAAAEILHIGKERKEHTVLYGKGGHAKSEMALEFFKCQGIEPFVKCLGQGTSIEDLLGGMNINLFKDKGIIEYNVENSFMNHKYVILEEGFDAPLRVLEQLKDILTSGWYRNGSQQFKIKTEFIVVCTNRSKNELADDDSLKALLERFPLELKVEWDSYKTQDYAEMFQVIFGRPHQDFAVLIEEANKVSFISPRTAVKALKIYTAHGLQGLQYVTGFTQGMVESLEERQNELAKMMQIKTMFTEVKKFVHASISSLNSSAKGSAVKLMQAKAVMDTFLTTMDDFRKEDSILKEYNDLRNEVVKYRNYFDKSATEAITIGSDLPSATRLKQLWKI